MLTGHQQGAMAKRTHDATGAFGLPPTVPQINAAANTPRLLPATAADINTRTRTVNAVNNSQADSIDASLVSHCNTCASQTDRLATSIASTRDIVSSDLRASVDDDNRRRVDMGKIPPSGRFMLHLADGVSADKHAPYLGHVNADDLRMEEEFHKMDLKDKDKAKSENTAHAHRTLPPVPTPARDSGRENNPVSVYAEQRLAVEAELRRCNNDGDTILHLAIIHQASALILQLVQEALDISFYNLQNRLLQTALHLAVLTGQAEVVRLLVARGVCTSTRDATGNTALHLACISGDVRLVAALTRPVAARFAQGPADLVDTSAFNYHGDTCLHLAVAGDHVTILRQLFVCRAIRDVNIGDGRSGRTILHHAVESRNVLVILFLLQNRTSLGLDVHALTYSGHSAVDLAASRRSHDLVELLELAGGHSGSSSAMDSSADSDSDIEMHSDGDQSGLTG